LVLLACGGTQKPAPVSLDEIARSTAPAIVDIVAGETKRGAGIVVEPDGLIATTLHIIEGQSQIRVLLDDRTEHPVVEIEGYDKSRDLALVRINPPGRLPTVRLGGIDSVTAGDVVYELDPVGKRQGTIDQVRALNAYLTIVQVSAENGRDWFGPVFNTRGEVIGLSVAFVGEPYANVIAVPASYLKPMVAQQRSMSPEQFAAETPPQAAPAQSEFPQMPPIRKPAGWRD
jgi:S1-C subfamily serine protease